MRNEQLTFLAVHIVADADQQPWSCSRRLLRKEPGPTSRETVKPNTMTSRAARHAARSDMLCESFLAIGTNVWACFAPVPKNPPNLCQNCSVVNQTKTKGHMRKCRYRKQSVEVQHETECVDSDCQGAETRKHCDISSRTTHSLQWPGHELLSINGVQEKEGKAAVSSSCSCQYS